jgi:DNA-binding NtrC family response regulator
MMALLAGIRRFAALEASVLVEGETGTGKELVARALHLLSPRAQRPLVTADCAALPETLAESELFGHERGAFTGAERRYTGRIEAAAGGTLFLDEVNSLPLPIQGKLLRFLELREFVRLGHGRPVSVDVRVISASNQPLEALVGAGTVRPDFYYRLNVLRLRLPPLRERVEDIPLLVEQFLAEDALAAQLGVRGVSDEVLRRLAALPWPGNVRELRNVVRKALVGGAHDGVLSRLPEEASEPEPRPAVALPPAVPPAVDFRRWMRQQERAYLERLVEGRSSIADQMTVSGLPQRTLYRKLRAHGLRTAPVPVRGLSSAS